MPTMKTQEKPPDAGSSFFSPQLFDWWGLGVAFAFWQIRAARVACACSRPRWKWGWRRAARNRAAHPGLLSRLRRKIGGRCGIARPPAILSIRGVVGGGGEGGRRSKKKTRQFPGPAPRGYRMPGAGVRGGRPARPQKEHPMFRNFEFCLPHFAFQPALFSLAAETPSLIMRGFFKVLKQFQSGATLRRVCFDLGRQARHRVLSRKMSPSQAMGRLKAWRECISKRQIPPFQESFFVIIGLLQFLFFLGHYMKGMLPSSQPEPRTKKIAKEQSNKNKQFDSDKLMASVDEKTSLTTSVATISAGYESGTSGMNEQIFPASFETSFLVKMGDEEEFTSSLDRDVLTGNSKSW